MHWAAMAFRMVDSRLAAAAGWAATAGSLPRYCALTSCGVHTARRRPPPRAPLPLPLTISQRMAQRVDLRVAQQATTHLTRHRRAPRRRSGPPTL